MPEELAEIVALSTLIRPEPFGENGDEVAHESLFDAVRCFEVDLPDLL
jgi:hypothetical protein